MFLKQERPEKDDLTEINFGCKILGKMSKF